MVLLMFRYIFFCSRTDLGGDLALSAALAKAHVEQEQGHLDR